MSESKKSKKILRYLWLTYGLFSIFIVLYLIDDLVCKDIMEVSNRLVLNDNWNITINGTLYENQNLDEFIFGTVMHGDVVVLETIVPTDYEYKEACICIQNQHTVVSMYVDGELQYEYGHDRFSEDKATGSGFLLVNFGDEYKGKKLRLEYIVVEDAAFSKMDSFWISEWDNSFRYILTSNRLPLLMGSFLLVLGVMTTFIQIFAVTFSRKFRNVLLLSLFSVCIGIWTLCYYDIMMLLAIPLYKISLIEHMSLFLSPIPILGYMHSHVKETNSKRVLIIYKVLLTVQIILTVSAITLHTLNIMHGAKLLKYFLTLFVVHIVFVAYLLYKVSKSNAMMSKFTIIGLVTVVICISYEVISYILLRHMGYVLMVKGVASVGLTIFIGLLIIELYNKVTRGMMEEKEKAILLKMAYTDELTKLHNRTFCSGYMRDISINKQCNYTIINFDLNGLKKVNDTYGHIKGDELICYAAIVLDKTFGAEGVVGRMGGDEFIAILETDNTKYINQLLDKFTENIREVNESKPDLGLSISYGYATSTEVKGESSEKIYQIADERMYDCKQKYKAQIALSHA